jgi:hypothetical protein
VLLSHDWWQQQVDILATQLSLGIAKEGMGNLSKQSQEMIR